MRTQVVKVRLVEVICSGLCAATLSAWSKSIAPFCEDFETGTKGAYASNDVTCAEGAWSLDNMLLGSLDTDRKNGSWSVRGYGTLVMLFDKTNGVGEITLFHGMYGKDNNANVSWTLTVSRDGGCTWDAYESEPQEPPTGAWHEVVLDHVNVAGPVRIKVEVAEGSKSGKRVNFDDIALSDFIAPALYVSSDTPNPFCARRGTASTAHSFVVSGMHLTNDVQLTAPAGFEIASTDAVAYGHTLTLPHTQGVLAATTLWVRLTGAVLGDFAGAVVVSSAGADTASVTVMGTVVNNRPPVIVGLPALTNVVANQTLHFEFLAIDMDGSVTQLTATSDDVPGDARVWTTHAEDNVIRAVWSWTPQQAGSNTVTFVATDNECGTTTWTVTVLVETEWVVAIAPGQTVCESFDTLAGDVKAILPRGWKAEMTGTARTVGCFNTAGINTERIGGNDLASNAPGGIYNFGAGTKENATDRAVGFLAIGSVRSGSLQAKIRNVSSVVISAFSVGFDVEKYRKGTNSTPFQVALYTSRNGLNWLPADEMFCVAFAGDTETGGYGEAPGVVTSACGRLGDLKLGPDEALYLAWGYSVATGTTTTFAQALAIDNVVIKAHAPAGTILLLH